MTRDIIVTAALILALLALTLAPDPIDPRAFDNLEGEINERPAHDHCQN